MEEKEEKDIRCECGKLLAKVRSDGKIMVWCKHCKKEVELVEKSIAEPPETEQTIQSL